MNKLMPIMRTGLYIRFDVLDEKQAKINHGQTLERLAERGGLSACEALAIAEKRKWVSGTLSESITALSIIAKANAPGTTQELSARQFADWIESQPQDREPSTLRGVLAEAQKHYDAEKQKTASAMTATMAPACHAMKAAS